MPFTYRPLRQRWLLSRRQARFRSVISTAIDPVGAGLAESLARPGANVTGLALETPEISAKVLSLLKEAVPALSRVAVLWNEANPAFKPVWESLDATAHSTGLTLLSTSLRAPQDFALALPTMVSQRPDSILVLVDALIGQHVRQIVEFATRERLPAASTFREFASLGFSPVDRAATPQQRRWRYETIARNRRTGASCDAVSKRGPL